MCWALQALNVSAAPIAHAHMHTGCWAQLYAEVAVHLIVHKYKVSRVLLHVACSCLMQD